LSLEANFFIASNESPSRTGKGSAKSGTSGDYASEETESGPEEEKSGTEAEDEGGSGVGGATD
jgi:hypothetical protein